MSDIGARICCNAQRNNSFERNPHYGGRAMLISGRCHCGAGYGLCTQGYGVWKLRHALNWRNVAPFIIGGVVGVPIGTMLLRYADPAYLRGGVGVLLVIYGVYGLTQPKFKPLQTGPTADGGVGFLNGILCGLTGFPGFIITIWCQLRGWAKDAQRAVFQPVILAAFVMTAISLGRLSQADPVAATRSRFGSHRRALITRPRAG